MVIYNYDKNGHYNGASNAQLNPRKSGEYLMPANSTKEAPPSVGPNKIAKYDGSSWSEVDSPIYLKQQQIEADAVIVEQAVAAAAAALAATEAAALAADEAAAAEIANQTEADAKLDALMSMNSLGVRLNEQDGDEVVARSQADVDAETLSVALERLRRDRNKLLTTCDYTQLPDAPITDQQKADYAAYRQELRDLPENIEDPKLLVLDFNHPSWPVAPS